MGGSAPRSSTPVWPGDPPVELVRVASIAGGDGANVSRLSLGTHTGSHVDAPLHVLEGGGDVESLPLDALVGECVVVDARALPGPLDRAAVESLAWPAGAERVLLATRSSELWERPGADVSEAVAFTGDGAAAALRRGVRLLGIDYLTIGDEDAHRALLAPASSSRRASTCEASSPAATCWRASRCGSRTARAAPPASCS